MSEKQSKLTWFITGCSSGFGLAIARLALQKGHKVIGTSRSPRPDIAAEFESKGGQLIQFDLNESNCGDVLAKMDKATPIDVLVNNAGFAILGPIEALNEEQVRGLMETLYFAPMRLVRALVPSMRRRGTGVVVSISSGAGVEGRESMGAYAPAKAAIDGAMKVLGKEMASFGVRVLTVQLGAFDTEFTSGGMLVKMDEEAEAAYSGSMAAKVMESLSGSNFQPDGDHIKASNVIYEVIVGEGVGMGRESERILPLGRDMGTRIQDTIAGWQHTMDVFGEVCNGVSKF